MEGKLKHLEELGLLVKSNDGREAPPGSGDVAVENTCW